MTTTDSSTTGPPTASQSRKRAIASGSVGFGSHRSGTCATSWVRPRRSLLSPPLGSSQVGAHQATTCDCARVNATYVSRMSSPATSLRARVSISLNPALLLPPMSRQRRPSRWKSRLSRSGMLRLKAKGR